MGLNFDYIFLSDDLYYTFTFTRNSHFELIISYTDNSLRVLWRFVGPSLGKLVIGYISLSEGCGNIKTGSEVNFDDIFLIGQTFNDLVVLKNV